jgi:4-hydroxybenzoate polyprenyl transferase
MKLRSVKNVVISNLVTVLRNNSNFNMQSNRQVRRFGSWLIDNLPKRYHPYLKLGRYDKPIGSILYFLPASWTIALYSPTWYPDPLVLAGFAVGASLIRAAGCAANDWWDRDFDRQVERCKTRPIASGEINTSQALSFYLFNSSPIPLTMLTLNPLGQLVFFSAVPIYSLYPLAKRYTNWPQAILGLVMCSTVPMGAVYMTGTLDVATLAFTAGAWSWALVYDSIYAYQDREDDIKAGVKSTAVLWGDKYKTYCSLFTTGTALAWTYAGIAAGLGPGYFVGLSGVIGHIVWQYQTVNTKSPKDCWRMFVANQWTGAALLLAIMLGKLSS